VPQPKAMGTPLAELDGGACLGFGSSACGFGLTYLT
jgi:hypothetical protein